MRAHGPHSIIDAAGNIFGTTYQGGPKSSGTVFEIVKTAGGYASSPTTLVDFTVLNGSYPQGGLIADAAGNLFGSTYGGGKHDVGTVFEITNSGFVVAPPAAAFAQAMAGHGPGGSVVASQTSLASQQQPPSLIYSSRAG